MHIKKELALGYFFSITQLFGQMDTNSTKLNIILGSWKLIESKIDSSPNNSISQKILDKEIFTLKDSCITFNEKMRFKIRDGRKGKFKFGERNLVLLTSTFYQFFLNDNEYYFVLDKDDSLILARQITENYAYRFRFVLLE